MLRGAAVAPCAAGAAPTRRHHQRPRPERQRRRRCAAPAAAGERPCVVVIGDASDARDAPALAQLAERVRATSGCEAVLVATSPNPASTGASGGAAGGLSFGSRLPLVRRADLGPLAFEVPGASGEDAVLLTSDPKAGLLRALGLAPGLVLAGVARGPALSAAAAAGGAALAPARAAALLGLPAVAACLASPSPGAPLGGALEAAALLAGAAAAALRRAGAFPACNHPRAHYPLPTRGRWALGRELPLPSSAAAAGGGGGGGFEPGALAGQGCWALGEDGSWFGGGGGGGGGGSKGGGGSGGGIIDRAEANRLLLSAFSEGDLLLLLNVPPTWAPPPAAPAGAAGPQQRAAFASVRPGVLWPCHQVEAHYPSGGGDSSSGGGGGGGKGERSWEVDEADLWGRSLPRQGYAAGGAGGAPAQRLVSGGFVSQDNTAAVAARWRARGAGEPSEPAGGAAGGDAAPPPLPPLPEAFVISRGTLLSDEAACGDVEAVMGGRAAVAALQAWPAGHPFSLRDELMVHALEEGPGGMPLWLC
ncbi:MAG: hypothetical protein J3K34DRAFT_459435 [Monoraphidium minutum]|nr:MAG: hypothetical protein J3K34DRAFT_459435 [Monoraphidium minutum]